MNSSKDEIDSKKFIWESTIRSCYERCVELFKTGIFTADGINSPFFQSAFIDLLINLNDLTQKAKAMGKRITSTEHVDIVKGANDITDLINSCRNAAAHVNSPAHNLDNDDPTKFTFNVVAGLIPSAFEIDGRMLGCDFEDDIAVFYGEYRLYIQRHVVVTLLQLGQVFQDQLASNWLARLHAEPTDTAGAPNK